MKQAAFDISEVPTHAAASAQRPWRWCLLRSVRVLRASAQHQRMITMPNLSRHFRRQWRSAADRLALEEAATVALEQQGVQLLRRQHAFMHRAARGSQLH